MTILKIITIKYLIRLKYTTLCQYKPCNLLKRLCKRGISLQTRSEADKLVSLAVTFACILSIEWSAIGGPYG